jgi:methylglyoxal synthase
LTLAEWVSKNPSQLADYTFVFTGNSGHELDNHGANVFAEKAAPKPEDTRLWIHLGATIAAKAWKKKMVNIN